MKTWRLRWAGHVAIMEEGRTACKIVIGKSTEKGLLGRPARRWNDNIKINLQEISVNTRNSTDCAQDGDCRRALMKAALKLRVPLAMELVCMIHNPYFLHLFVLKWCTFDYLLYGTTALEKLWLKLLDFFYSLGKSIEKGKPQTWH